MQQKRTISEAHKEAIRKANTGHTRKGWSASRETKQRISDALKRRWKIAKQKGRNAL
jgi:hypothetical protein